jgi:hypothetical protein
VLGLALSQQLADRRAAAAALKTLGAVARAQGDEEGARAYYAENLALYEQLGDRRKSAECRERLAEVCVPLDGHARVNYARDSGADGVPQAEGESGVIIR